MNKLGRHGPISGILMVLGTILLFIGGLISRMWIAYTGITLLVAGAAMYKFMEI